MKNHPFLQIVVVLSLAASASPQGGMSDLIVNGDFSQGNAGFSSEYGFGLHYYIVTDAGSLSVWWTGGDHTTGAGLFMVVDGVKDAEKVVWSQSISVVSDSDYQVGFWYRKVDWPFNDIAQIQLTINGTPVGNTLTPGSTAWAQFSEPWNSGASTVALLEIRDLLTVSGGNGGDDFGLDDFSFVGPTPTLCQSDLGFGGPGAMRLSICGPDLATGVTNDLLITGAPALGTVFLVLGLFNNPTAYKGGQIVPLPRSRVIAVAANSAGEVAMLMDGGNGPATVYVQAVAPDATQPEGFAVSNALEVQFLP